MSSRTDGHTIPTGRDEKPITMKMEKFEYTKAVEELESIAAKVEDPNTGIDDIDKYIRRSEELIEACRAYLRGAREKLND
jgi:exodeoxyribonuclease VII small subunit